MDGPDPLSEVDYHGEPGPRRGSLLLDVHSRVAMQILRHANVNIAMEIHSQPPSTATRDAIKKLGEALN